MNVVEINSKTKLPETPITKKIGAFLFKSSLEIEELTNESITIWIETNTDSNIDLCKSINLQHFILGSVFGDTTIYSDSGLTALCELANEGNIPLEEGERIKFKLDNLKPTASYSINGIQYPVDTESLITFDRKTILAGESEKQFGIEGYNEMVLSNSDTIEEIEFTYVNGSTVKYPLLELQAMAYEMDNFIVQKSDGATVSKIPNILVLDITNMTSMEVLKGNSKEIHITLRTVAENQTL